MCIVYIYSVLPPGPIVVLETSRGEPVVISLVSKRFLGWCRCDVSTPMVGPHRGDGDTCQRVLALSR